MADTDVCRERDEHYMRRAIALARMGAGWANPNPMVGAVIVKDGRIIGEGWHPRCGELHAERQAIASLSESAKGAAIYVTLEPCCHYGKTPPCTEAILEQGISRVVIGSRDPNPLVSGKGAELLRSRGVTVEEDFLREECDALNPVFFHYITTKRPYVVMKYAMTLDGKIATRTGASQWITGEKARAHVHGLRGRYAAILAGIGTVLADDPMLNCRSAQEEVARTLETVAVEDISPAPGVRRQEPIRKAHQPLRVIVDSSLRIPLDSRIVESAGSYSTLVACAVDIEAEGAAAEKRAALEKLGIRVISLPEMEGAGPKSESAEASEGECGRADITEEGSCSRPRVDLAALMEQLGQEGIDSVLIEGGGQIHEAALSAGIVDHVCAYVAPKIFGGLTAKTPVEGLGAETPEKAYQLCNRKLTVLGDDLLLEYDRAGASTKCSGLRDAASTDAV